MAVIVIGGHTRNIGKTSVVCGLIAAMRRLRWTAVKITQFGHGVCSANGEPCDCEVADHTLAISEERDASSGTDSSRYLAAGAVRSLWVRTRQGQLAEAIPRIRREIADAENLILESNSVLRFIKPDLFLVVLDPTRSDFKPSSLRYLDRADAILLTGGEARQAAWAGVSLKLIEGVPQFRIAPPTYCTEELVDFVANKIPAHTGGVSRSPYVRD